MGNPRSGTTLLRLMLDVHQEIAAAPECGFLHWWYNKYKNWEIQDAADNSKITAFVNDLFTSRKIENWQLDRENLLTFIKAKQPAAYAELGLAVYQFWAAQEKKAPRVILDKNNYYIDHLEDLAAIWPDATFIWIVRDGRDVACSYKAIHELKSNSPYKPRLPVAIEEIAREWSRNNLKIQAFLEFTASPYVMIRLEDLILQPEKTLTEVTRFFDLPYDPEMTKFYQLKAEPDSTMDWKPKTRQKLDGTTVGKYKHLLRPAEIARFEEIAGDVLKHFNYELHG